MIELFARLTIQPYTIEDRLIVLTSQHGYHELDADTVIDVLPKNVAW